MSLNSGSSVTLSTDCMVAMELSLIPRSESWADTVSSGSLSILSTITQVLVKESPSIPSDPSTSSSTFLLLTLTTTSS